MAKIKTLQSKRYSASASALQNFTKDRLSLLSSLETNYPRTIAMMKDGKSFIVISDSEAYYPQAYALIRESEMGKGTWTDQDEATYQAALISHIGIMEDAVNQSEGKQNDGNESREA